MLPLLDKKFLNNFLICLQKLSGKQFISTIKVTVIGVLAEKGSSMGMGGDRGCMVPITIFETIYLLARQL